MWLNENSIEYFSLKTFQTYEAYTRKIYSDELKMEVIKPWIGQLPISSGTAIHIPLPMILINEYTEEEKLDVEKHDLFGVLESHLDPDVFDSWESFKDLGNGIYGEERAPL